MFRGGRKTINDRTDPPERMRPLPCDYESDWADSKVRRGKQRRQWGAREGKVISGAGS